jgi:uncharacterized protein (TIGR02391 family)
MQGLGEGSVWRLLGNGDLVSEMPTEELAGIILQAIKRKTGHGGHLSPGMFTQEVDEWPTAGPGGKPRARLALQEAFHWLVRQGLLMPQLSPNSSYFTPTRFGATLMDEGSIERFRSASLIPKQLLHDRVAETSWPPFLRADYDTAIFTAFKEVEIAVRDASGLGPQQYGVELMRKAFGKNGPLAAVEALDAERDALVALFCGATGSYKNPHSHRRVGVIDSEEAAQLLFLASHLLRIVDSRKAT